MYRRLHAKLVNLQNRSLEKASFKGFITPEKKELFILQKDLNGGKKH